MKVDQQRLLTLKEAANYCGMPYKSFCEWFRTGKISSVPSRPGSPRRKILPEQLEQFIAWLKTDEANQIANGGK